MILKNYLEKIGIDIADNDAAIDFLMDKEITDFICSKYGEKRKSTEENKAEDKTNIEDIKNVVPETADILNPIITIDDASQATIAENGAASEQEDIVTENKNIETMGKMSDNPHEAPMNDSVKERARDEAFALSVKNRQMMLQNGKVAQPYHFVIDKEVIDACEIGDFWFEGLETIGLQYDKETYTIKGTPTQAGDHKIKWFYKCRTWSDDKSPLVRDITLIVTPDPRSLSNNIPTPSNVAYPKPDCDKQVVRVKDSQGFLGINKQARKDMVAASQRGRSHAHEGVSRDDDFRMSYNEKSEWYIITVADGAGSAKYSRRGSEIACRTVIDICSNLLEDIDEELKRDIASYKSSPSEENRKKLGDDIYNILGSAVFKSYKNIESEAQDSSSQIRDFSTTLIVAICRKFKFGWFIASFWVGDGGIGIYNKDTQFLKILGDSDGGEFAGQTRFLTMPEIIQPGEIYRRLRFDIVDDFTALILMSDGITDPKFETDANLLRIEKWNQLWDDLSSQVTFSEDNQEIDTQLLGWLDFWSPGNHDDRTIAILF